MKSPWRTIMAVLFTVEGVALLSGCEPKVEVTSFEPIPYEEILGEMSDPTGKLVDGDATATASALETSLPDNQKFDQLIETLNLIYRQFETVLTAVESSSGGTEYTEPKSSGSVKGTRAFVKVACLGPDILDPDLDFENGYVYLESPSFTIKDALAGNATLNGDMIGEFRDKCTMGEAIIEGDFPGYIDDYADRLMMDIDIQIQWPDRTSRILFPILLARNAVKVLLKTKKDGNYVLGVQVDDGSLFSIGTENGFFQCEIGSDGASCGTTPTLEP
jgi:hypothetical protein